MSERYIKLVKGETSMHEIIDLLNDFRITFSDERKDKWEKYMVSE